MRYETEVLQFRSEIAAFIELLKQENVRSYLEIGARFGGSLWLIGNALPTGSRLVAVDLPTPAKDGSSTAPSLTQCAAALRQKGQYVNLIFGDSTDQKVIDGVYSLAPFDCVLIDANHTEPYVRKDWANYGKIGRMICFHDINYSRPSDSPKQYPIQVPKVWNEIKQGFRHQEIRMDKQDNGFGILWP